MKNYQELVEKILEKGAYRNDRTGTGTISIFGERLEFDMREGFPLVTTKYTWYKGILHELLWFISGDTNIKYLQDNGVHIWDEWATEEGELGPIYGSQWRYATRTDQLQSAIDLLRKNPASRRIIVDSWQVKDLPNETLSPQENVALGKMALAPCHMMFQFYVRDMYLDIQMYQRSVDVFLGLPFNIASYATLLHMVAKVVGLIPGKLVWVGGDTHLYANHIEQAEELLTRDPKKLPTLVVPRKNNINDYVYEDFELVGYDPHPAIKAPISV